MGDVGFSAERPNFLGDLELHAEPGFDGDDDMDMIEGIPFRDVVSDLFPPDCYCSEMEADLLLMPGMATWAASCPCSSPCRHPPPMTTKNCTLS